MALFAAAYGEPPRAAASAPGRVNLLGEHTHDSGGPVLPIATRERTLVAVGPGEEGVLEVVGGGTGDGRRVQLRLNDEGRPEGSLAYLAGVLRELAALGAGPPRWGARVAIASDLEAGVGLASSAALAVAATRAFAALGGGGGGGRGGSGQLTARQVGGVAFRAEHHHAGVSCGVMDHEIAALARPDHALLVECASTDVRQVPLLAGLLLVDPGVRRERKAAEALLEQRRAECAAALTRLRVELPELYWLASWPAQWVARLKRALPEPLRSRALHVIGEAARTRFGAELLRRGRLTRFGELMYESHESSRRLFEWSAPELDTVVAAARRAGAPGARLTGIAASGAVLVLLDKGDWGEGIGATKIDAAIRRAFVRTYRREPAIKVVRPGGGVRLEAVR